MKSLADALGVPVGADPAPDEEFPANITAKQLAKRIITSKQYRESIARRILTDSLPAAVECRLYDYAYGKPVDRVEVKDITERLEDLSNDELQAKALELAELARALGGSEVRH